MTLNQEIKELKEIMVVNNFSQNIIKHMERIINLQEKKINQMYAESMGRNWWFTIHHPEMAIEYVEACYLNLEPNIAKTEVGFIHDEIADLSKISCTGNDFKTWD
jgi:hypothetical protein